MPGWVIGSPTTRWTYFGFISNPEVDTDAGTNQFIAAGSDDGITWHSLPGDWAGPINAPEAYVSGGDYYFQVGGTYDQHYFIVPWKIGKAASNGIISTVATIDWTAKIAGVTSCNSGSWFTESGGAIHLFVPCGTNATVPIGFQIYETHPLDATFLTWSDPVLVTVNTSGGPVQTDIYDPVVELVGSTYFMWLSHEDDRYIELASSTNLLGPYTMVKTGDWAGWGNNMEGPTLYQPGGAGTWRLAMEHFQSNPAHQMYYSDCNTADFTVCTWTAKQPWVEDQKYRHGSIIGPNF